MKKYTKTIFLVSCVVLSLFAFKNVKAIEYEMLGGKPANPDPNVENSGSWFIYNLSPGEAKEDAIEVANLYSQSWEALIYAADTTKSSSGGFALRQFSEPKEEVGTWVKFYPNDPPEFFQSLFEKKEKKILILCGMDYEALKNEMKIKTISDEDVAALQKWCQGEYSVRKNLESKERIAIPFIIRIPDSVDVGDHTGGILIQKANEDVQESGSGSSIKLTTRVGVRIYETVPGEVVRVLKLENYNVIKNFKEFSFADLFGEIKKPQEYIIQSTVRNEGNVSIEQAETVKIKDLLFGKRGSEVNRNFQVLKKDSFISNYAWNNPRFGYFAFSTEIKYKDSEGNEAILNSGVIKKWIIPWREMSITAVLFAFFFGIFLCVRFYRKKKYGGIGWVEYVAAEGDNVNNLADKFGIPWKVLAKTNKLEAPYLLQVGQVLLVPAPKTEPKEEIKEETTEKSEQELREEIQNEVQKEIAKEVTEEIKEEPKRFFGYFDNFFDFCSHFI